MGAQPLFHSCQSNKNVQMAYLILARKYRPIHFKDVVGQQHVTVTLQNAIEQNRLANAYLFSGPRGVGKTTVARLLSKALNCDQGPTTQPCNTCSSCVEINESRSLDVLEIDGASNRGIDEVRNLRDSLRYLPNVGKYRIYIIDEVHMLTNEAFNALLKTLEEPPSRVMFIFATTEVHKVPATILSRCQRFDFKRITNNEIIKLLQTLCEKEEINIDTESLRLIANKGDGSMRDAESILDQIIAYSGTTINAEQTAELLGIIGQDLFFQVTDLIQNKDVQGGIDLVQHIFSEGYDFNEFLIGLSEHLRNFMVVKATGSAEDINVSEEHGQRYLNEADQFEIEDLLRLIKIASDTENLIRRSKNARIHLEIAVVKMIKMNSSVELAELVSELDDLKKKSDLNAQAFSPTLEAAPSPKTFSVQSKKSIPSPPQSTQTEKSVDTGKKQQSTDQNIEPEKVTLSLEELEEKWPTVLEHVKRKKIALGSLLSEGWPTRVQHNIIELSFHNRNGFHISSVNKQKTIVESLIQDIVGHRLRIKCIKTDAETLDKVRKIPSRVDKRKVFVKLQKDNHIVKEIVEKFDAELTKFEEED